MAPHNDIVLFHYSFSPYAKRVRFSSPQTDIAVLVLTASGDMVLGASRARICTMCKYFMLANRRIVVEGWPLG